MVQSASGTKTLVKARPDLVMAWNDVPSQAPGAKFWALP